MPLPYGGARLQAWGVAALTLMLAGCQTAPTSMPVAEPAPSASCHWTITPGSTSLAEVVDVLENRDFLVRDTDTELGVVSADRAERAVYHNADAIRPHIGGVIVGGSGGYIGVGTGVGIGIGGGRGTIDDATRIERVSVAVGETDVRVTRDIRLYDWAGDLRESRTASDAQFCQDFRAQLERRPVSTTAVEEGR